MNAIGAPAERDWSAFNSTTALQGALRQAHYESFTGRLTALGAAAVEMRLVDGLVTAIATPAAPGPDSLLLKSGRVNQADWSRAVDTVGEHGRLDETLVSRALVPGGELDVIRVSALFDGMFAVCLDAPEDWETRPPGSGAEPALPLLPGVPPATLLAEAGRRYAKLTHRWGSPAHLARARPHATAKATHPGTAVIARHREILLCANGRRTPRDIAFVLGRGVYAVMVDLGQLESRGMVQAKEPTAATALPSAAPRRLEADSGTAARAAARQVPQQLPQRAQRPSARAEGMTPYPSFDRTQADRFRRRLRDRGDPGGGDGEPPRPEARDSPPHI